MDFTNVQWLNIVNRALALISSSMLSKLDDGTEESNYAAVLLPQAVEEVYSSIPFDDIAVYARLPRLADGSEKGSQYSYSYKLPDLCASLREVILDDSAAEWQRINGAILTDSGSVSIRYVPLPTLPSDIPFYARALICVLLASRLAGPIAHNESLATVLRSQYEQQLSRAYTLAGKHHSQESYASTSYNTEVRG